jgi:OmpA-OmpF porin, OOP family
MTSKLLMTVTSLLLGSMAYAQYDANGVSQSGRPLSMNSNYIQRGFAGYLAAGAGYAASNDDNNLEGAPTSLKLLGSFVTDTATGVFDFGYGVQSQKFSQSDALNRNISTGVMELATRYQFENRWQLGAIYNQFFNKGENYNANQADVQFGGVQLLREFSFGNDFLGRVGGRLMSSLNVDNESVNMAIIDFQIGWGGAHRGYSSASTY